MEENMAGAETQPQQPNPEAFHLLLNPDFNSGNLTIYFSSDPKGFEVVTDKSLPRKDGPLPLNTDERAKLKFAMEGEMKFTGGSLAKMKLDALRNTFEKDPNSADRNTLKDAYLSARDEYVNLKNKPKVGVRNIRRDGNKLIVDIKPVTYPVFSNFSNREAKSEVRNFAESAATIAALVTSDNKLLVVHRADKNELYPGLMGAIAGNLDGIFDRPGKDSMVKKKGTLTKIDGKSILSHLKTEAHEELGLDEKDYNFKLVGFCEEIDTVANHAFLFEGKTTLSSLQIRRNALTTQRARKDKLKPEDIEEKFDFIDATPEAIFTMLTKVQCPIGPDHAASYVTIGYNLMLKRNGEKAAFEYKQKLEREMVQHAKNMNGTIEKYFQNYPQRLTVIPERLMRRVDAAVEKFKAGRKEATEAEISAFREETISKLPKRNPKGFSPHFLPEEQGLLDYNTALRNERLIS